jgi:hypothetical protein
MTRLVTAVRILPMNRQKEFMEYKDIKAIQEEFFLHELPLRKDCYYRFYRGVKAEPGTMLLFQIERRIIARAILHNCTYYKKPDQYGYRGQLSLEKDSIRVFDPVSENVVKGIWPNVKRFSHVKWHLNPDGFSQFEDVLHNNRIPANTNQRG